MNIVPRHTLYILNSMLVGTTFSVLSSVVVRTVPTVKKASRGEKRSQISNIFNGCHICLLKQCEPRKFLFSTEDTIIRKIIPELQIDVMKGNGC